MQLYRHLTANHLTLKEMPFVREIAMEAYLLENPDILALDDDELSTVEIVEVELAVPGGRIDLLALYGESTVGVIELKLGELNRDHLKQLEDYLSRRDEIRGAVKEKEYDATKDCRLLGVLVGTSIASDLRAEIEGGRVVHQDIPIAALTVSRYAGEDKNVYVVTDTFFRNVSQKYDRTQYEFNGTKYGKGRLVLACIKKYVEGNPEVTFSALETAFPRNLQGSRGCFDAVETAQEILLKDRKRHFLRPDELIDLSDARIAVCNQWGIGNIDRFIDKALTLGFKIEVRP